MRALPPAVLIPWFSPARQVECGKQYYCKNRRNIKSWIGVGKGVDFCFFVCVVLFWIGGLHCGVILLLLFYLISGKCWRDALSYKVHKYTLHYVCRRWLNTDDPAVHVFICKILLSMEMLKDYVCRNFYKGTLCTCSVDACTIGLDVQQ